MNRDSFTCRFCGDNKNTLNVHHLKYSNNPWDVNSDKLITLCQDCHELIESFNSPITKRINSINVFRHKSNKHSITSFFSDDCNFLLTDDGVSGAAIFINDNLINKLSDIIDYYKNKTNG